jgi:hypothetical protein
MPDDTATPTPDTGATPRQRVHVDAEHDGAIRDGDMLMAVAKGSAVGIPVVFAILFLIDLLAGLDAPMAALGASIPAVIFGAFIGTAFFIGRASDAAAARAHS